MPFKPQNWFAGTMENNSGADPWRAVRQTSPMAAQTRWDRYRDRALAWPDYVVDRRRLFGADLGGRGKSSEIFKWPPHGPGLKPDSSASGSWATEARALQLHWRRGREDQASGPWEDVDADARLKKRAAETSAFMSKTFGGGQVWNCPYVAINRFMIDPSPAELER